MESRIVLLDGLFPRKARVGHGTACRDFTLTSQPLSFICTAHIISLALVLPEERSRKYVERLDLCLLEVLAMKKLHEKVCLSRENSKGTTMTSCLQWLNAQNSTGFERATVTQVVGKAVWSCWQHAYLVERGQDLSPLERTVVTRPDWKVKVT